MTGTTSPFTWLTDRLGFRFAFLLAAALLPLLVLAITQTDALRNEARARSEAALLGETTRAVSTDLRLIQHTQGAAAAMALAAQALSGDPARCSSVLRSFVENSGIYSFASFVTPDGTTDCNSRGMFFDFSRQRDVVDFLANPRRTITVDPTAAISRQSIIVVTEPAFDSAGTFLGMLAVSLPHAALARAREQTGTPNGLGTSGRALALITFSGEGDLLTSSVGVDEAAAHLPQGETLQSLAMGAARAFSAPAQAGDQRTYSLVPLVDGELYALGSWRGSARGQLNWFNNLPAGVLPALMWLASVIVAWFAAEKLVTRYIRELRRSITSFAGGSRVVGTLDVTKAPREIRDVAEAYLIMTDTIRHDEAELEDTIHQKEVLLREVHHRVKNNLQLIASIMSMQMRQTYSPEAKAILKSLHDRVISLATVHRDLYQTTGLTDVRSDELMADIVRQVVNMGTGPGRRIDVTTAFDPIRLTPDQAVPLALLLTEALTNALKYADAPPGVAPQLEVRLDAPEGVATLTVRNSIAPNAPGASGLPEQGRASLGTQLVTSFAQQLGARLSRHVDDTHYVLSVEFAVTPLSTAEARHNIPA